MSVTIREAIIEDAVLFAQLNEVVHKLHAEAQPERFKPYVADSPELLAFYQGHLASETTFAFIAEDNGQAIGYLMAFLRIPPENPFIYSLRNFHIDQMAVAEAYQGQGVGHQLMETALAVAKDLDAKLVTLGVAVFNETAIHFYEKHGFKIQSHRMWQMF